MQKLWIVIAAAIVAGAPAFAQQLSIHGEPAAGAKAAPQAKLRLAPLSATNVTLSPVSDTELAPLQRASRASSKRTAIGIEREIGTTKLPSARGLAWKVVDGGTAAQLSVSSPQAGSMRLAIDLAGVPGNVQMVVFGSSNPSRLEGPFRAGDIVDRTQPWWTPLTDGDTQTVEIFVPSGIDPATLALAVSGVAHVFTTLESGLKQGAGTGIGTSGSCEVDVKCSSLYSNLSFQDMRNGVAQMTFQDGRVTYLCTGQLLNDTDTSSQIPWFFSANHCFDNDNAPYKTPAQMQVVASTLQTLWFFEAVTCTAPPNLTVPNYVQLSRGATYVYSNVDTDILFIKLNDAAPTGSFFNGWNANALGVGTAIVNAHHPMGDLKKVSQGSLIAQSPFPLAPTATTLFNEVQYSSGTTEGGSSGSGLYSFDGTEYQLRGALFGGSAACSSPKASDWYSQFDKSFSYLQPYLAPAVVPAANYTDLWWNANESGWGLNIVQHVSNEVFAVWFTYGSNGMPTWYTLTEGTWTSPTVYAGKVYATTGPAASSATFNQSSVVVRQAGTATLSFSDANNGGFTYTIDGVTGSKAITRQPY
ncbi:MAG TPA: hypothetical protein VMG61_07805 [Usitatibacter sp.]|nr:hypothetical protein [Usitatibacter sp.]